MVWHYENPAELNAITGLSFVFEAHCSVVPLLVTSCLAMASYDEAVPSTPVDQRTNPRSPVLSSGKVSA
jgi:hypothetical protein